MADFSKAIFTVPQFLCKWFVLMSPCALQTQWHFNHHVLLINPLITTYNLQQSIHFTDTIIAQLWSWYNYMSICSKVNPDAELIFELTKINSKRDHGPICKM